MRSRRIAGTGLLAAAVALAFWGWSSYRKADLSPSASAESIPSAMERTAGRSSAAGLSRSSIAGQPSSLMSPAGTARATVNDSLSQAYRTLYEAATADGALRAIAQSTRINPRDKGYFAAFLNELCSSPMAVNARSLPADAAPIVDPSDSTQPIDQQRARVTRHHRRLRNYCQAMPVIDAEAIRTLWLAADEAGDARAKARLTWSKFEGTFAPDPMVPESKALASNQTMAPVAWNRETLDALVGGMSAKDPSAIVNFGMMLQQSGQTNYVALSATGDALSTLPVGTWAMVACDYGGRCGSDNPTVLNACATEARCDVASLEAYYRKYQWTAEEAARYDALAPYLRQLIESGQGLALLAYDPTKPPVPRYYVKPPRIFMPW